MKEKRGVFITIEGVEGVGKTTNIETIETFLQDHGVDYLLTREPGGTPIAEKIRDLLLSGQEENFSGMAELLLIFAARAQHLQELIRPALDGGKWVVCDRFTDATFAYQGAGRELGTELVGVLQQLVQGELRPDCTLLFDLDPAVGLQRIVDRRERDRFESEELAFFRKVRQCYLDIAAAEPGRCAVIDASDDLDQVRQSLLKVLVQRLGPYLK